MADSITKIREVAFLRLRVPDLDKMQTFLEDFGLTFSARTDDKLFMRGTGTAHHLHVTELGETALLGFAFYARSEADLEALAACDGASDVHDIDEPGGGRRVKITDPNGLVVELIHGVEDVDCIDARASMALNFGARVERRGELKRMAKAPSRVMRLGHVGFNTPDPDGSLAWYRHHFGILPSDNVSVEGMNFAFFTRCDRGDEHTDHHSLLIARAFDDKVSLNHCSFEVEDLDDIWLGHEYLHERGYRHSWGIGRHRLGSQLFDYWRDPWGNTHEHYTDGDLVTASFEAGDNSPEDVASQWGPQMPPDFGQLLSE